MDARQFQEQLDRADAHVARSRNASASQATYIEALARDGPDAATARRLLKAFAEIEGLHETDNTRRPRVISI